MMKIQIDTADIEKLLTAYCPRMVQHSGNKYLIRFGEKQFKGNLNCKLCNSGAEISIGLK